MARYISKQLLGAVPTLLILTFIVSLLVRLAPGDIVDVILQESEASQADAVALREELGLNQSIPAAYLSYLGDILNGSLGHSLFNDRAVLPQIVDRAVPTLELAFLAFSVSAIVGITVGTVSALRRGTPVDFILRFLVNVSLGLPNFVVATLVVLIPAYLWSTTVPLRYVRFTEDPIANLTFYIAPALTLGTALSASISRISRTTTLDVVSEDFVRTARAKGLPERNVIRRHILPNSILPVMTLLGIQVAFLLSGSIIVEQVFNIPGLGTLLLEKLAARDYPMVQGITLVAGAFAILVNVTVDVLYGYVDPRLGRS